MLRFAVIRAKYSCKEIQSDQIFNFLGSFLADISCKMWVVFLMAGFKISLKRILFRPVNVHTVQHPYFYANLEKLYCFIVLKLLMQNKIQLTEKAMNCTNK